MPPALRSVHGVRRRGARGGEGRHLGSRGRPAEVGRLPPPLSHCVASRKAATNMTDKQDNRTQDEENKARGGDDRDEAGRSMRSADTERGFQSQDAANRGGSSGRQTQGEEAEERDELEGDKDKDKNRQGAGQGNMPNQPGRQGANTGGE